MSTMTKKTLPDHAPEQHTEKLLLERLQNSTNEDDYFRWLLFVVGYYRSFKKNPAATELLERYLKRQDVDAEKKAHCYLALGQIATDEQRLDAALNHFHTALCLEPTKKRIVYVIRNNLGYCLNRLGRFTEGEKECRQAIAINGKRASAYRNLGVSLEGQGRPIEAAWAYVEAVKADPSEDRSRALLEKFVAQHAEVVVKCPWISEGLNPEPKSDATPLLV
jgi:tetratricopeptide (TPR) repeat protein